MKSIRRVGVFASNNHVFGQGVLEGISTFCQVRTDWKLVIALGMERDVFPHLMNHLDGVIAGIPERASAAMLATWGKPCVNVYETPNASEFPFPLIYYDQRAIGRVGAEHLLGLGFHRLAFCGYKNHVNTNTRYEAFQETVRQAGANCFAHRVDPYTLDWPSFWKSVAEWVAVLPKPIGLMAVNDSLALEILDACREQGINVPDQVAVLGMDNDLLLCQRTDPPLSSVDPGVARIGFQAACLLEEMMSGKRQTAKSILLPPLGVVSRASTDTLSLADPQMVAVVRYIREHACDPMQIEDLLSIVPLSRRSLERRFFQARGRSPHEEIRRIQLQRAQRLLIQTYLPLEQVARASGFGCAVRMVKVFRTELGVTPGEHRRHFRQVMIARPALRPSGVEHSHVIACE